MTLPLALMLVMLSAVLIALRVEQVTLDFAQGRSLRAAQQLRDQLEGSMRLGLALSDQPNLQAGLQRMRTLDVTLAAVRVDAEQGDVVAQSGSPQALAGLNPVWSRQLLAQGAYAAAPVASISRNRGTISFAGVPVADATGRRVGVVWLAHDRGDLRQGAWTLLRGLWPWAVGASVLLVMALGGLATRWMRSAHARLGAAAIALAGDTAEARDRTPQDIVRMVDGPAASRSVAWRKLVLLALAFGLTFAMLAGLAWKARELARPMLLAQIDASAHTLLSQARAQLERALQAGIPAQELVGVQQMLQDELEPATGIAFVALQLGPGGAPQLVARRDADDELMRSARAWLQDQGPATGLLMAQQPVQAGGVAVGRLVTGTPARYVDDRLRSVLLDLLFAVIVSLVLVREVLGAMWERSPLKPYLGFETAWQGWRARAARMARAPASMVQRLDWLSSAGSEVRRLLGEAARRESGVALPGISAQLVRIRLLVFLTALSDELLRPFFAVFASEARPLPIPLSPTMLAGLPVAAFMLMLALAQPLGPWITRRVDMRRALFVTALAGAALVAATAATSDSLALTLLRAGSGGAYGLILILAQTTIVRITDYSQRARGLVEVSAAIVAAGVCGPALGGLIVERLGTGAAFAACAACLVGAAVLGLSLARLPADARGNLSGLGGWRGMAAVMRHRRVMSVTWFAAVPARLAAAALLVVVTPLYLLELGESPAVSGQAQLLYFLAFMVTAPWVARWSDLGRRRKPWILWGCALSALACGALPLLGGVAGIAVSCGLLGVAQSLLSAPQLALVTETFDRDPHATQVVGATPEQALAAFRLIERFGSILAPFAVALAVAQFGLAGAAGAIGLLLALGGAGVAVALFRYEEIGERHDQA